MAVRIALAFLLAAVPACTARTSRTLPARCPNAASTAGSALDTTIYGPLVVTGLPRLLRPAPVEYPPVLGDIGQPGRVMVEAVIGTDGRAEPATVRIRSSSDPRFDSAAVRMVLASSYCPGTLRGRPVRVRMPLPVNFKIQPWWLQ